jgi:hypothetical protein
MFKIFIVLVTTLSFQLTTPLIGHPQNPYIATTTWNQLKPHFLPEDHPIKQAMDEMFAPSHGRIIKNTASIKKAGFTFIQCSGTKQPHVVAHNKLKGYLLKIHTDDQNKFKSNDSHRFYARIKGAELTAQCINQNNYQKFFTVPKKWIYPLPVKGQAPSKLKQMKNFILVVEDVHILSSEENAFYWKSPLVTKELLEALVHVVIDTGLDDSIKIDNIPFTKEGKIAFIDTEAHHIWPVYILKLKRSLTKKMQACLDSIEQRRKS